MSINCFAFCITNFSCKCTSKLGYKISTLNCADFVTDLGGTLTATISATDTYDEADDDRTASFSVDTETPWLMNPSVSPTSAGEADSIVFSVVYCVFDSASTGTPVVGVEVNSDGGTGMVEGDANAACKNGNDYSLT